MKIKFFSNSIRVIEPNFVENFFMKKTYKNWEDKGYKIEKRKL